MHLKVCCATVVLQPSQLSTAVARRLKQALFPLRTEKIGEGTVLYADIFVACVNTLPLSQKKKIPSDGGGVCLQTYSLFSFHECYNVLLYIFYLRPKPTNYDI